MRRRPNRDFTWLYVLLGSLALLTAWAGLSVPDPVRVEVDDQGRVRLEDREVTVEELDAALPAPLVSIEERRRRIQEAYLVEVPRGETEEEQRRRRREYIAEAKRRPDVVFTAHSRAPYHPTQQVVQVLAKRAYRYMVVRDETGWSYATDSFVEWYVPPWGVGNRGISKEVVLPASSTGVLDRGRDPNKRYVFNVTRDGRILFRHHSVSLGQLVDQLAVLGDAYGQWYELDGERYSKLYCLVWADRDAPWQHVSWALQAVAKQRFLRFQFGVTEGESTADPVPRGTPRPILWLTGPEPPLEHKIEAPLPAAWDSVRGVPELTVVVKYDGGANLRVTLDDLKAGSLEDLERWLREAGPKHTGRIQADPRTPWRVVIAVLDRFRRAGIEHVRFAHVPMPDHVRTLDRLPPP